MYISNERRLEVGWMILKNIMKKKGTLLDAQSVKKDFGNAAKEIGVPPEELKAVAIAILEELTQEAVKEFSK